MAEAEVRIALLARAGKARDQLRRALSEAGANVVVEGDPAELDPAQVAAAAPTVFLVSLEPAVETALDRFDELLAAPDIEVMFDDAEVTGKLDGWDLNRWARHLAGKLLGGEMLPPAPEGAFLGSDHGQIGPGAPPTPAQLMDGARLEDYTGDASELADSVPVSPSLYTPSAGDSGMGELELEGGNLDFPDTPGEVEANADGPATEALYGDLDLVDSVSFSSFRQEEETTLGDLDADVAELAAQLEAFERSDQRLSPPEPAAADNDRPAVGETIESVAVFEAPAAAAPPAAVSFDFSNLALTPMEGEAAAPARNEPVLGAVLVLAGLGGPDAVRQLLSSLPEQLAVPVLLYQHLEVGKHERLVEQLAKISRLPVVLAQEATHAAPGKVTLLPAGMTAGREGDALVFAPGSLSRLISALSPTDSMVIVLSGAEPQLVPQILAVRDAGGLVLAQDPEVCFDPVAAKAMQREGAAVYPALGLARQIATRWQL